MRQESWFAWACKMYIGVRQRRYHLHVGRYPSGWSTRLSNETSSSFHCHPSPPTPVRIRPSSAPSQTARISKFLERAILTSS